MCLVWACLREGRGEEEEEEEEEEVKMKVFNRLILKRSLISLK